MVEDAIMGQVNGEGVLVLGRAALLELQGDFFDLQDDGRFELRVTGLKVHEGDELVQRVVEIEDKKIQATKMVPGVWVHEDDLSEEHELDTDSQGTVYANDSNA
jgi:hypothetical protein